MSFWKSRTTFEKILIIIITIGFLFALITYGQKVYFKYKYYQAIEKDYKKATDSIAALNLRLKDLTQKQENRTKLVQKKSKSIDDKLKQDEKTIDNSDPGDDELLDFIAKHEQR